jgi:peptidoglycan/LPS O-acetylase OafA/YrhL
MGLVRLFLALVVAGDHFYVRVVNQLTGGTRGVDQYLSLNGGFAVMLFYCLSGFLISYILAHKYSDDAPGTRGFYKSRFLRIFPLYWAMLAFSLLLVDRPQGTLDTLVSLTVIGGDWVRAFRDYPAEHNSFGSVLGQAWSIGAELTFYAMAPWLLRSLRVSLLAFGGSLALRLWLQSRYGFHQAWTYHFFPSALCFFLAGHLARVAGDCWPRAAVRIGPTMLALAAVSTYLTLGSGNWISPWFYVMIGAFAASLPWLFSVTKDNRVMNYLSDLSYPLYLGHLILVAAIGAPPWLAGWLAGRYLGVPGDLIGLALFSLVVTAGAALLYAAVERPCRRMMDRAFAPIGQPLVAVAAETVAGSSRPEARMTTSGR